MRIAFDCQAFVLQSYGGVSRYFTRLIEGLLSQSQIVTVIAPLHRNNYITALPKEVVCGRYINGYPGKTARLFLAYNQIISSVKTSRWKPEVVHETYYSGVSSSPKNCPTVVTVYDMIHELYPEQMTFTDNTAKNKRKSIERADHIICISENTRHDLIKIYGTPSNKISVVHLGFDSFEIDKNKSSTLKQKERPFILYVGVRSKYKNFTGLIKAVASSGKLRCDFDIIAFGGGGFTNTERAEITSLGFTSNQVRNINGGDNILGVLYNSAAAFVYPSIYEGFGIPPLEAMAQGCPVISSNTSSMPEVIGGAAEYFDPLNVESMRCAIEVVVYSQARTKKLIKLGWDKLKEYSWDKCAVETLDVYDRLL